MDHEASKQYGIYVAKYEQMLSACIQVRLMPTEHTGTANWCVGMGWPLNPAVFRGPADAGKHGPSDV